MSTVASPKKRVAVVFGGRSTEHGISCASAGSVLAAIDRDRYDVIAVGITREGSWVLAPDDPKALAIHGRELPEVAKGSPVALLGDPSVGGLVALEHDDLPRLLGALDVVFPLLHGPYGEDGTIQGLLELAGVAYVGAGVLASAVAMDKEYMKKLLAAEGLAVTRCVVIPPGRSIDRDAVEALGLPVFVKPARGGSSIGISRVDALADLDDAVAVARRADPKVLVEAMALGREVECGVLGGLAGAEPRASVPGEIRVGGAGFYDFAAKYVGTTTELIVPAALPGAVTATVQAAAVRAFRALGCEGLARVDFFLQPDGLLVVNEVNTMPGFTPYSMFPRMWAASGLAYPALVDRLVRLAVERGTGLR